MAIYNCKAITKSGKIVRLRLVDSSRTNVLERIRSNGLRALKVVEAKVLFARGPKKIQKKNIQDTINVARLNEKFYQEQKKKGKTGMQSDVNFGALLGTPIKEQEVMAFTQSFQLLKKAGFTNVRALTALLESTKNIALRDIISDILNGIEAGEYIYSTMAHYPNVFSSLYVNIIKVGELSDSLPESLGQALKTIEEARDMRRKMRKAVTQPLVMIISIIALSIIAVIFGLPVMQDLYGQLGVEDQIPPATIAFANFVNAMGRYWYIVAAIIAGIVYRF